MVLRIKRSDKLHFKANNTQDSKHFISRTLTMEVHREAIKHKVIIQEHQLIEAVKAMEVPLKAIQEDPVLINNPTKDQDHSIIKEAHPQDSMATTKVVLQDNINLSRLTTITISE